MYSTTYARQFQAIKQAVLALLRQTHSIITIDSIMELANTALADLDKVGRDKTRRILADIIETAKHK